MCHQDAIFVVLALSPSSDNGQWVQAYEHLIIFDSACAWRHYKYETF